MADSFRSRLRLIKIVKLIREREGGVIVKHSGQSLRTFGAFSKTTALEALRGHFEHPGQKCQVSSMALLLLRYSIVATQPHISGQARKCFVQSQMRSGSRVMALNVEKARVARIGRLTPALGQIVRSVHE